MLFRLLSELPAYVQTWAVESFERESVVEILKAVDTMRFPNKDLFKKRLQVLVRRQVSQAFFEARKDDFSYINDDDDLNDDELLTRLSNEKPPTPADLVIEKEKRFDVEELIKRFEEMGFWDEADYLRKFVDGRGRLSKYEMKKVKGAVRFLLLSMGVRK